MPSTIPPAIQEPKQNPALLLFSAARAEALKAMVQKYTQYLLKYPERLADVAYTLAERREHLRYRTFLIVDGTESLPEPAVIASQDVKEVAFVFTGQGAQW